MASPPKAKAYHIVSDRYPPFDGAGAHRWGSRWVSPGRWVVHAAETYSLAILENLVHWQSTTLPPRLLCVTVQIPPTLIQQHLHAADVPGGLDDDYIRTRAIGDAWYDRGDTAELWVPSLVSMFESNVLFNQRHSDFKRLVVAEPIAAHLDRRLGIG